MRKLWLLAAAASLLLVARAPQAHAQASVVTACGTVPSPLTPGYANTYPTVDPTGVTCVNSSGGGGGGAVTVAAGADVTEGNTTDAAVAAGAAGTISAKLRTATTQLNTINTTLGTPLQAGGNVVVTGTVPLPTLAATSTKQSDGTQKTQIVDGAGAVIASTSNNLNVQCANCSGSGASAADEASFTAGTSVMAPAGVFFQTTATSNALTNGQQGMIQGTANRAAFVNLRNASGAELGVAAAPVQVSLANTAANATAVKVDGSAVTQPVSGTVAVTGTFYQATQPVSIATAPALVASSAVIGKVGIDQTTPGTTNLVALAANQSVNVAQINGVTPLMGNGTTGTGSQRVTIASDNSAVAGMGVGATGSAVPANASFAGGISSGNLTGLIQADTSVAINVSTATTTQLVALSSGKKIYVTALDVIAGGTGNITFEYGTGSNCGTGTTVLTGAYNLTAQTGLAKGSGLAPVLIVPASNALCVLTSAAVQMSGSLAYTQF